MQDCLVLGAFDIRSLVIVGSMGLGGVCVLEPLGNRSAG